MLLRLTGWELKKTLRSPFLCVALILLLLLTIGMNCGIQEFSQWKNAVADGSAMDATEESLHFFSYLAGCRRAAELQQNRFAVFEGMEARSFDVFQEAMEERYGTDVLSSPIPNEGMTAIPGYFETCSDFDAILAAYSLVRTNDEIKTARARVVEAAKRFGREAVASGDDYGIRRNLEIVRLYSIPGVSVTSTIRGWEEYLNHETFLLPVMLLVLLTCAGSCSAEKDQGAWHFLATARNGRTKTLLAKYLSGAITAAGLTILFQGALLCSIWFKGGLYGGSQPVTALEALRLCPWSFTILEFAVISGLIQMLAAVFLSILVTTVSANSRNSLQSYGVSTVILGVLVVPLFISPRWRLLEGPLSLTRLMRYFEGFVAANVFTFPVLWLVLQVFLWMAICALCVVLSIMQNRKARKAL